MAKQPNLGRGLAALLGDEPAERPSASDTRQNQTAGKTLDVGVIEPGMAQPRRHFDEAALETLAQSLRDKGMLQPILVRPHPTKTGRFEIIAGERRWRAAQLAKMHEVPVIIKDMGDRDAFEIALIENIQREDLNPLEEAEGYERLIDDYDYSQEQLAKAIGKSRSHIANILRLMNLPEKVKKYIREGKITAGHARALIGASNAEELVDEILSGQLTVRDIEKRAAGSKKTKHGKNKNTVPQRKDRDIEMLERDLSNLLGLKVTVTFKGKGGDLTISYSSLDQLDDVLMRLNRGA